MKNVKLASANIYKNVRLARQVIDLIENEIHPKQYDMETFLHRNKKYKTHCGTVACLAGWTVFLYRQNNNQPPKTIPSGNDIDKAIALLLNLPHDYLYGKHVNNYPPDALYLFNLFMMLLPEQQAQKSLKKLNAVSLQLFQDFFDII